MSINAITSPRSLETLTTDLMRRLDTNQDSQLSTDEFTRFLTTLMGSLDASGGAFGRAVASSSSTSSTRGAIVSEVSEAIEPERLSSPDPKSPKDLFLSKAQYYAYDELPELLADLQSDPASAGYFTGWTVDRDKLIPPASRQNGVNGWGDEWGNAAFAQPIDVIEAYDLHSGTAKGWSWGV